MPSFLEMAAQIVQTIHLQIQSEISLLFIFLGTRIFDLITYSYDMSHDKMCLKFNYLYNYLLICRNTDVFTFSKNSRR